MKSHKANLVIIDGCGDELLDRVLATVNYELSGDGSVLVHTDDLENTQDTNGLIEQIQKHLDEEHGTTSIFDAILLKGQPPKIPYEGLILLRR